MTNEVAVIDPKQYGLEETQANELTTGLTSILAEREILKEAYLDVISLEITEDTLLTFRALRLKIRDNRTKGLEVWHKTNKAYFLAGGRFVDAIKNKEVAENERMESQLFEAEKHFENIEKERIAKIQSERIELLTPFVESTDNLVLSDMDEDVWLAYLSTKKQQFEDKIEAEKKVEAERLESIRLDELEKIRKETALPFQDFFDKVNTPINFRTSEDEWFDRFMNECKSLKEEHDKEVEAQRLENERLRKEAEQREKEIKVEREQREKIQAELEAKQKAEAEEIGRRNAEIIAKQKEDEKLAKAPIKKQMKFWVDSFELPNIAIDNNTQKEIVSKFKAFKDWATSQIELL